MFLVTALLSYIVTSTQDEGVGGGEEDEEGEETKATAKARGKGKATPTTTVSNEGAADSDMPEPGKSSATRTKRTVDAAGKRNVCTLFKPMLILKERRDETVIFFISISFHLDHHTLPPVSLATISARCICLDGWDAALLNILV